MCGKFEFVGNIESEDGMKIIFKVDDIVVVVVGNMVVVVADVAETDSVH
jgi:hypothetical protein